MKFEEEKMEKIATKIKTYIKLANECYKLMGPNSLEGHYWEYLARGMKEALEILQEGT